MEAKVKGQKGQSKKSSIAVLKTKKSKVVAAKSAEVIDNQEDKPTLEGSKIPLEGVKTKRKYKKNEEIKHPTAPYNIELLGGLPKNGVAYTFDECSELILTEIKKRKPRWLLNELAWFDYDDVIQTIMTHIFIKWHQWDQRKPLLPWVNRVVTHQTINIVNKVYTSHVKPCMSCEANESKDGEGNFCRIYGEQSAACPLYAKWEQGKKAAQALFFAESYETAKEQANSIPDNSIKNPDLAISQMHEKILPLLTKIQKQAYRLMIIENKSDQEVAKIMKYETTESKRLPGYKQIENYRKIFLEHAKALMKEGEIFSDI